ncbi:hypothetical protein UlMin_002640 [Ulmus minor]
MEETTEETSGYSNEPVENSGTCTVNIGSDQCTGITEENETAPADVSSYDWLSIVDMLGLQKHPAELVACDVVGKELPLLEMWECFYTTYSRSVGFGIRIHTTSSNECRASQIRTYKYAGLRTCDIVNLMVQQAGGFERLGFTRKDTYNKAAAMHRAETVETDSEGLLGYLASKIDSTDPTLYAKYAIDEEDRLCHIFWSDNGCQRDYMCFSDVLAFDTTYRSNAFNKPLVMFIGVNNHFRTCKIKSYKWVLETFLDCMHRRQPTVVVTDGDAAMKATIILCFPDSTHRICGWHMSTNATLNIKSPDFTKAFRKLLYNHYNVPQWYERWDALLDKFELHDNAWAATTYEQRFHWA